MSMYCDNDHHARVLATAIVFSVVIIQTALIKTVFESNPDSAIIVILGFLIADVLAVLTWLTFSKKP
ncbi:hypothetical protein [Acinetobacter tandoii]|uniref:hypothetical protein n=1 Tax=Acinetobacter tandoii TaxID=202954 RepID=UPI00301A53C9